MKPSGNRWLERIMRLYPREYRERFGDGMLEMLRQQHADAGARGRVAVALFRLRTVRDALFIGATERWRGRWLIDGGRKKRSVALSVLSGSVVQDLRYAARALVGQPMFTGMTVMALVVGIGFNTSLFTALDAVFFRQWDVANADRIVRLLSKHPMHGYGGLPIASARHFEQNGRTIDGAFVQRFLMARLGDAPDARPVRIALVSGSYFDVLDVGVAYGRSFVGAEDVPGSHEAVVMLSHALWQTRYAGEAAIVGSTVLVDGVPFTVVGVAEESFAGTGAERPDLWLPLSSMTLLRPLDAANMARLTDPEFCCSEVYGRLSAGSTHAQAAAELSALFGRFSVGAREDGIDIAVVGTALFDHPEERQHAVAIVVLALAAFGSILVLACANVSNMLIARGAARQREIGVRMAIGASRGRVIRQLLTECLVLAGTAGALSVLLAPRLPHLVMRLRNQPLPEHLSFSADGTVLAFAMGISVFSVVLFGVAPAIRGTRMDMGEALRAGGRGMSGRFRLQPLLIGVQVAVSVALLATAGLLLRGLHRARSLDPGFRTADVTALRVQLPPNRYGPARERAFFDEIELLLESAGVRAGAAALMPFGETMNFTDFVVPDGSSSREVATLVHDITPGYLQLLEIPVVAGRGFQPGDREQGAILVTESLARLHWPDSNPVGQTVMIGQRLREVVGVVRDARLHGFGTGGPMYFAPFAANSQGVGEAPIVLVPTPLTMRASDVIRRADRDAVIDAVSLAEQANRSLADSRGAARLAALLAFVALLLSTSGVYGVVSYSVEQRRREIGTRIALGARPREVIVLILRRNGTPLWMGLVAGLVLTAGASSALRGQLYGLYPLDPAVIVGLIAILGFAGFAASAIPARRALRVDPVKTLQLD